ncbi:MAG: DEAD/DEAH box helicase [Parcubacteria group bacterium]
MSGGRPPYRGGRPTGNRRSNSNRGSSRSSFSDITKFINKPEKLEEEVAYASEHSFKDFNLEPLLQKNIENKGYIHPTPIQDKAIPVVMSGQDVVGIANTGTGKTAAFLIPILNKIIKNPKEKCLVVVPTRELATQIDDELKEFAKGSGFFSVICIGGTNIGPQIRELRHANNFVIGTPGRLRDLMEQKILDLSGFKNVVLDEADRMLDMGFITDIRFMMSAMPKGRHTLFFSATLSSEIEKLIHEFLHEPVRISVKTRDTAKNVHQDIVRIPRGADKVDVLHDLLIQEGFGKVLVFGRTKHGVEKLSKELTKRGIRSESIHGNKSQRDRQRTLDLFKSDKAQVLTATDVAARGLDISGVTHVINFDLPATYDDYVHRIGRTGRAGELGKALTFME